MSYGDERLTVGLIGTILAVIPTIAALTLRVAPAAGALVLRTGQSGRIVMRHRSGIRVGRAVHFVTVIRAVDMPIASDGPIQARSIAEELIGRAIAGG